MGSGWLDALRPVCEEARRAAPASRYSAEAVLFYLARWCQKKTRSPGPNVRSFVQGTLREAAERIARNLADYGPLVERLVDGDAAAWTELRGELRESARSRAGARAHEFAEEALQKIAIVILTGTPPSKTAQALRSGPEGPRNEYVFDSPFTNWARTVVINLIKDDWRRGARRSGAEGNAGPRLDRALVERARAALPGLLQAIRELPGKQRSVMILSLNRRDVDEIVRERLHELAPDLFSNAGPLVSLDEDIAQRLGSTPRRVAANRSAARRKLARRDPSWALLLDILLPHRSTRPVDTELED